MLNATTQSPIQQAHANWLLEQAKEERTRALSYREQAETYPRSRWASEWLEMSATFDRTAARLEDMAAAC